MLSLDRPGPGMYSLLPQPLQLPQNHQVRIQKSIHTVPHTGLLVLVQLAVLHVASGYAFAETGVGEGVYC
jgi:hypothetical protein